MFFLPLCPIGYTHGDQLEPFSAAPSWKFPFSWTVWTALGSSHATGPQRLLYQHFFVPLTSGSGSQCQSVPSVATAQGQSQTGTRLGLWLCIYPWLAHKQQLRSHPYFSNCSFQDEDSKCIHVFLCCSAHLWNASRMQPPAIHTLWAHSVSIFWHCYLSNLTLLFTILEPCILHALVFKQYFLWNLSVNRGMEASCCVALAVKW